MSLRSAVKHVPLREALRVFRALRRQYASIPWPEHAPGLAVDAAIDDVDVALRSGQHFESGVSMSYYYQDEVLNLRRPEGLEAVGGRDGIQMQGHIRARRASPGVYELVGHIEPDPDEHPRLHIDEVGFRWDRDWTRSILESAGFDPSPI